MKQSRPPEKGLPQEEVEKYIQKSNDRRVRLENLSRRENRKEMLYKRMISEYNGEAEAGERRKTKEKDKRYKRITIEGNVDT